MSNIKLIIYCLSQNSAPHYNNIQNPLVFVGQNNNLDQNREENKEINKQKSLLHCFIVYMSLLCKTIPVFTFGHCVYSEPD